MPFNLRSDLFARRNTKPVLTRREQHHGRSPFGDVARLG